MTKDSRRRGRTPSLVDIVYEKIIDNENLSLSDAISLDGISNLQGAWDSCNTGHRLAGLMTLVDRVAAVRLVHGFVHSSLKELAYEPKPEAVLSSVRGWHEGRIAIDRVVTAWKNLSRWGWGWSQRTEYEDALRDVALMVIAPTPREAAQHGCCAVYCASGLFGVNEFGGIFQRRKLKNFADMVRKEMPTAPSIRQLLAARMTFQETQPTVRSNL